MVGEKAAYLKAWFTGKIPVVYLLCYRYENDEKSVKMVLFVCSMIPVLP
jgi:hypothetical protein